MLAKSRAQDRFAAMLMGTFAALALVLAASGLYGILAQLVAQVTPHDPASFASVPIATVVIALLASWIPGPRPLPRSGVGSENGIAQDSASAVNPAPSPKQSKNRR